MSTLRLFSPVFVFLSLAGLTELGCGGWLFIVAGVVALLWSTGIHITEEIKNVSNHAERRT